MPTPDTRDGPPVDHRALGCRGHVLPRLLAVLLLVVGLTACGSAEDPSAGPAPTSTGETAVPEPTPREVDPGLADVVDTAVADLADRLGVPEDQVTVVSAETVSWGDTSLGCPQPGMKYAQVVTEGTRTVLAHDGTTYAYHSGAERPDPFLCEHPQQPAGSGAMPAG